MQYLQLADGLEKKGRGKARFKKLVKGAVKVVKTAAPIAVNFIPGGAQAKGVLKLAKTAAGQKVLKFATSKAGGKIFKAAKGKVGKFAIDKIKRVDLNKLRGGLRPKALGLTPVSMPDAENEEMPQMMPEGQTGIMVKSSSSDTILGMPKTTAIALGAAALAGTILLTRKKR